MEFEELCKTFMILSLIIWNTFTYTVSDGLLNDVHNEDIRNLLMVDKFPFHVISKLQKLQFKNL